MSQFPMNFLQTLSRMLFYIVQHLIFLVMIEKIFKVIKKNFQGTIFLNCVLLLLLPIVVNVCISYRKYQVKSYSFQQFVLLS